MSRTYRTIHNEVEFCKICDKPIHYQTVEKFELCKCQKGESIFSYFGRPYYTKKNVKSPDGKGNWHTQINAGTRKFCQQVRNKKTRLRAKQALSRRDRHFDYIDLPVIKKEVDWDLW